ncbi:MAG TPA: hypothetical protein VGK59_14540 [Ohtaekwangia sp.]
MALENNIELLDNYVANRMSATEKAAFEQQLQADPQLQRELEIQQQIREGIRQARITELKTMLGNVPVSAVPGTQLTGLAKLAIGTFAAAIIGAVAYFSFKPDGKTETQQPVITEVTPENPVVSQDETKVEEQADVVVESTTPDRKTKEPAKPNKNKKSEPKKDDAIASRPAIDAFDPAEETQPVSKTGDEMTAPVVENSAQAASKNDILTAVDNTNKKYKFHYVLKENKLTLYGDFESSLYEIIEVFNNEKRTAFLFFKNNYYLMNEDNDKIKPLTPINDPVLLKKLREYRAQKN